MMDQTRESRRRFLARLSKKALIEYYKNIGYLASAHPLSEWSKEEIIGSILDLEFRDDENPVSAGL